MEKKIISIQDSFIRKNETAIKQLWKLFLSDHEMAFCRNKALGRYKVDFYSAQARLAIMIDDPENATEQSNAYYNEQTAFLKETNVTLLRFTVKEVLKDFDGICVEIDDVISKK